MTGPGRGNKGRIGDLPGQIANSTSLYHERIVIPNEAEALSQSPERSEGKAKGGEMRNRVQPWLDELTEGNLHFKQ